MYLLNLGNYNAILQYDNDQILYILKKLLVRFYNEENTIFLGMFAILELLQLIYQVAIDNRIIFDHFLFDIISNNVSLEVKKN